MDVALQKAVAALVTSQTHPNTWIIGGQIASACIGVVGGGLVAWFAASRSARLAALQSIQAQTQRIAKTLDSGLRAEAQAVLPEIRREGLKHILLVTSNYHTRRAGRCFRKLADGLSMRVIAAPDENFRWDSWWLNREAQKVFYMEWSKTIFSFVGM